MFCNWQNTWGSLIDVIFIALFQDRRQGEDRDTTRWWIMCPCRGKLNFVVKGCGLEREVEEQWGCTGRSLSTLTLSEGEFSASTTKTYKVPVGEVENVLLQAITKTLSKTQKVIGPAMEAVRNNITIIDGMWVQGWVVAASREFNVFLPTMSKFKAPRNNVKGDSQMISLGDAYGQLQRSPEWKNHRQQEQL